jgi:hypothetical protein
VLVAIFGNGRGQCFSCRRGSWRLMAIGQGRGDRQMIGEAVTRTGAHAPEEPF